MKDRLIQLVEGFPVEWQVLILAALPIAELRAAIPLGVVAGLPILEAFILGVIGNLLPVGFLLVLLPYALRMLSYWGLGKRLLNRLHFKVQANSDIVDKYGFIGLFLFVVIPFPGTGAWTGSLVAVVLEMQTIKAFIAIAFGVLGGGAIIALGTFGLKLLYQLGGALMLLGVIVSLIGCFIYIRRKRV